LVRIIYGRLPIARVETRLPAADAAALKHLFAPELELATGRAQTVVTIDRALLSQPLPQAEETTRTACEQQCMTLLQARTARTGIAQQVRARLLEDPRHMPSMTQLARELNLDTRTLHRRLAAEDTSYRGLREELLETLATELLQTAQLTIGEVAYRLGYSDPVAFTHAFTRWTGTPPSRLAADTRT